MRPVALPLYALRAEARDLVGRVGRVGRVGQLCTNKRTIQGVHLMLLWQYGRCFCGNPVGTFVAIRSMLLWQRRGMQLRSAHPFICRDTREVCDLVGRVGQVEKPTMVYNYPNAQRHHTRAGGEGDGASRYLSLYLSCDESSTMGPRKRIDKQHERPDTGLRRLPHLRAWRLTPHDRRLPA